MLEIRVLDSSRPPSKHKMCHHQKVVALRMVYKDICSNDQPECKKIRHITHLWPQYRIEKVSSLTFSLALTDEIQKINGSKQSETTTQALIRSVLPSMTQTDWDETFNFQG